MAHCTRCEKRCSQSIVKRPEEEGDIRWRVVELDCWKPLVRRPIDRLWEREQVSKDFGMSLELSSMHLERNTSCDKNDVAVFEPDIGLRGNFQRGCHSGLSARQRDGGKRVCGVENGVRCKTESSRMCKGRRRATCCLCVLQILIAMYKFRGNTSLGEVAHVPTTLRIPGPVNSGEPGNLKLRTYFIPQLISRNLTDSVSIFDLTDTHWRIFYHVVGGRITLTKLVSLVSPCSACSPDQDLLRDSWNFLLFSQRPLAGATVYPFSFNVPST